MTLPDEPVALSRRGLLRGATLGGAAVAAATLLPTGLASASGYGGGDVRQVPGVTTVIDTSHAEHDVSVLFSDYFGTDNLTKSRLPADQFPKDFKESLSGGDRGPRYSQRVEQPERGAAQR